MKNYFVYIMASKTGTLYVGMTNNLDRRVYEHKNKLMPGFTSQYNVNQLMYYQEFSRVEDALLMEKTVKKWNRNKKINLIKSQNPTLIDLSAQ